VASRRPCCQVPSDAITAGHLPPPAEISARPLLPQEPAEHLEVKIPSMAVTSSGRAAAEKGRGGVLEPSSGDVLGPSCGREEKGQRWEKGRGSGARGRGGAAPREGEGAVPGEGGTDGAPTPEEEEGRWRP
jgi:hypothetical protein